MGQGVEFAKLPLGAGVYRGRIRLDAVLKAYILANRTRAQTYDLWVSRGESTWQNGLPRVVDFDSVTYKSSQSPKEVVIDLLRRGYLVSHDGPDVNPEYLFATNGDALSDLGEYISEASFWGPFGRLFLLDPDNRVRCPFYRKAVRRIGDTLFGTKAPMASMPRICTVWETWECR